MKDSETWKSRQLSRSRNKSRSLRARRSALEVLESRVVLAAEIEPNNSLANAQLLMGSGTLAVSGYLSASPDIDYFTFYAKAGTRLSLNLRAAILTGKEATEFDPVVGLFSPNGVKVAHNDDGGTGGKWPAGMRHTLSTSGFWTVAVTNYPDFDFTGSKDGGPGRDTGAYRLTISGASTPSLKVTAEHDNFGEQTDRDFGHYLPGVELQNKFTVDLGPNVPDKIVVQYQLGGGPWKAATPEGGKWHFTEDMGALPTGQNRLQIRAQYRGRTINLDTITGPDRFAGIINVADKLPYQLQFNYGAGWVDNEQLRIIDSIPEGSWAVQAKINPSVLLEPYRDDSFEAVFRTKSGAVHGSTILAPQGNGVFSVNDSSVIAGLKDIVANGDDYDVRLQVPNKTPFSASETLFVTALPKWMGTPTSAEFTTVTDVFAGQKAYRIDVTLPVIDQKLLPDVTGLPFGILEGAKSEVHTLLKVTVYALPTTGSGHAQLRAKSWEAGITVLGKPFWSEGNTIDLGKVSVTAELDPRTLKSVNGIHAKTQPIALPTGSPLIVPIGGDKATLRLPVLGGIADAYVNLSGTFIAQFTSITAEASIRVVEGRNGLALDPAQTFVRVSPKAEATLVANVTGGLILNPLQIKALSLLFRGEVTLELDGRIQANFGGPAGVSFDESTVRAKLGGSLKFAWYTGSVPAIPEEDDFMLIGDFEHKSGTHYLFGKPSGKSTPSGTGLTSGDTDAAPLALPASALLGPALAGPMSQLSNEITPIQSTLGAEPTGTLRYDLPITSRLQRIRYDVVARTAAGIPAADTHFLQAVLVGSDDEIILQQLDLAELTYAATGDGFVSPNATQDLLIPAGLLDPAEFYELELRLFTLESPAERVEVRASNLRVDEHKPALRITSPRHAAEIYGLAFGPGTDGARTEVIELGNVSPAWLQVRRVAIIGEGFELVDAPPGELYLGLGQSIPFKVRLLDPSQPASAVLRVWSNDPDQPVFDLPLSYDGAAPLDLIAPQVTDIRLRGAGWSPLIASHSILSPGPTLQWTGIDQIEVVFSEAVNVGAESLVLRGVNRSSYDVVDFEYDADRRTATWTLSEPLNADRIEVELWAEGPAAVADLAGNRLTADSSRFHRGFDILPGDVNADGVTNILDVLVVRSVVNVPSALYPERDVNGDGVIDNVDVAAIRAHTPQVLPSGAPAVLELLTPLASQSVEDGQTLEYLVPRGVDGTHRGLHFELLSGPNDMTIDPVSGRILWHAPEYYTSGTYTIAVQATTLDAPQVVDIREFELRVLERNEAPQLRPIENQTLTGGSLLSLQVLADDRDIPANTLSYSLEGEVPAGVAIDPHSGLLTWQPTQAQSGRTWTLTVSVVDDGVPPLGDVTTFDVFVESFNEAPELQPVSDLVVVRGETAQFAAIATDDKPVVYTLSEFAPAGASIDPSSGIFTWSTDDVLPGEYAVTVIAVDADDASLTDLVTVWITIDWPSQAPLLDAIEPLALEAHEPVELDLVALDPQNRPLVFGLGPDAPAGVQLDPYGALTWQPDVAGQFSFTVLVWVESDPSLSHSRTVEITVLPDTTAPIVSVQLVSDSGVDGDNYSDEPGVWGNVIEASGQIASLTAIITFPDSAPSLPIDIANLVDEEGYYFLSPEFLASLAGQWLADGPYTVIVTAVDAAGNSSQSSLTFTLDTIPPEVSAEVPSEFATQDDDIFFTVFTEIAVVGQSEPGASIELRTSTGTFHTLADESGAFRFDNVALLANENWIEVISSDLATNSSSTGLIVLRHPQPVDPPMVFAEIADTGVEGDSLTSDTSIEGSVSSYSPIVSFIVTVEGTHISEPVDITWILQPSSNFEFYYYTFYISDARVGYAYGEEMADGQYTVRLDFTTEDGLSTSTSFSFTLDRTAPSLTAELDTELPVDLAGRLYTSDETIALSGQTEPFVTVFLAAGDYSRTMVSDENGYFRFDDIILVPGFNSVYVSVEDQANNISDTNWQILLVSPTVSPPVVDLWFASSVEEEFGNFVPSLAFLGEFYGESPIVGLTLTIQQGSSTFEFDVTDSFPLSGESSYFYVEESYLEELLGDSLVDGVGYSINLRAISPTGQHGESYIVATRLSAPLPIEIEYQGHTYLLPDGESLEIQTFEVPVSVDIWAPIFGSEVLVNGMTVYGAVELGFGWVTIQVEDPVGNIGYYYIDVNWPSSAPLAALPDALAEPLAAPAESPTPTAFSNVPANVPDAESLPQSLWHAPLYVSFDPTRRLAAPAEPQQASRQAVDLAFQDRSLVEWSRTLNANDNLLLELEAPLALAAAKRSKSATFEFLSDDWDDWTT